MKAVQDNGQAGALAWGESTSEGPPELSLRDHLELAVSPERPACAAPLSGSAIAVLLYLDRPISPQTLLRLARCSDRLHALEAGLDAAGGRLPLEITPEMQVAFRAAYAAWEDSEDWTVGSLIALLFRALGMECKILPLPSRSELKKAYRLDG